MNAPSPPHVKKKKNPWNVSREQIALSLLICGHSLRSTALQVGLSVSTVQRLLRRALAEGVIEKLSRGTYRVTLESRSEAPLVKERN